MPKTPFQYLPTAVSDYWHFFAAFLRCPRSVGAVAPSSERLAQTILDPCRLQTARVVVELGAGTGAITSRIHEHIGPETTFLALEIDEQHVRRLRERFPGINVCHESAENIRACLVRQQCGPADCIVSGLPWGNMNRQTQERIMREVRAALKPGGRFCGFSYLHASWYPSSRAFRRYLQAHFPRVDFSPVVWRNLPPAFAYSCL